MEDWLLTGTGEKLHKPTVVDGKTVASCDKRVVLDAERTAAEDVTEAGYCSRCDNIIETPTDETPTDETPTGTPVPASASTERVPAPAFEMAPAEGQPRYTF